MCDRQQDRRGKHAPWTKESEAVLVEHIRKRIARSRRPKPANDTAAAMSFAA